MNFNLGDVVIRDEFVELIVDKQRSLRSGGSVTYCWAEKTLLTLPELLHLLAPVANKCRTIARDTTSLRTGDIVLVNEHPCFVNTDNSNVDVCITEDGTEVICVNSETCVILFRENLLYLLNRLLKKYGNLNSSIVLEDADVSGLLLLKGVD